MSATVPRILIIDDEHHLLIVLAAFVRRAGYEVITAENGAEGLRKALTEAPDLILCDVMMPPPNGFELKKLLAENPRTVDIPFIFLTARSSSEDKVFGFESGADDYITKPFNDRELLARIKAILRRTQIEKKQAFSSMQQQMEMLRQEVLQNVTQELRSPLVNIMSTLEMVLLRKYGDAQDHEEFFQNALSSAQYLRGLIDDIIILNDIDGGSLNTFRQIINLKLDFKDILFQSLEKYKSKGLDVHLEYDEGLAIYAPKQEFKRTVFHLADNAFKYSLEGGVVDVRLFTNGMGGCKLTVQDEGPGIPIEMREKVFERYFQYPHPEIPGSGGGLGIGLTIARAVARSVRGEVNIVDSSEGCIVEMILPALYIEYKNQVY